MPSPTIELGPGTLVGPNESLDRLTASWEIFQLTRGHRFSTDDSLTALMAGTRHPGALRLLDIGAGIGSVGLMTLFQMKAQASLVMVEVQELSHRLAAKTVAHNGLGPRVELRHADLRDQQAVPEQDHFDLITGSPPYLPLGTGVVSPHPQRAGARMELKGDVFDYCRTAARALAPDGQFVFCHAAKDQRPLVAIADVGLVLNQRQDVLFRAGQPPSISVFGCSFTGERAPDTLFTVRDAAGEWTEDLLGVRQRMGLPA